MLYFSYPVEGSLYQQGIKRGYPARQIGIEIIEKWSTDSLLRALRITLPRDGHGHLKAQGETKGDAQAILLQRKEELIALYNPILADFMSDFQIGTATFDNPYLDLSKAMNLSQVDAWKVSKGSVLYLRFAVKKGKKFGFFSGVALTPEPEREKSGIPGIDKCVYPQK